MRHTFTVLSAAVMEQRNVESFDKGLESEWRETERLKGCSVSSVRVRVTTEMHFKMLLSHPFCHFYAPADRCIKLLGTQIKYLGVYGQAD